MTIYITSINFDYDEGYSEGFQGVKLNFTTNSGEYTISGKITISRQDYLDNSSDINELRDLVKNKIIADLSAE